MKYFHMMLSSFFSQMHSYLSTRPIKKTVFRVNTALCLWRHGTLGIILMDSFLSFESNVSHILHIAQCSGPKRERRKQLENIQIHIIYFFQEKKEKKKCLNKMNRVLFSQYENYRFKLVYNYCIHQMFRRPQQWWWFHVKKQCDPSAVHTASFGAKEQIVHSVILCSTNILSNMWLDR